MKRFTLLASVVLCLAICTPVPAQVPLLREWNFIIAIDTDGRISLSNSPAAEGPANVLDGIASTKYLNFAKEGSGIIVTPSVGPTTVQSMFLGTANDAPARDPASWALYGTNQPIVSANHSNGEAEAWTFIAEGAVAMPDTRLSYSPLISFANSTPYSSYRLHFPTLKNSAGANSMQIADVFMLESIDGSGNPFLTPSDPILAVHVGGGWDSRSPAGAPAQWPSSAIDNDPATKYLNFAKENSGIIVTPSVGQTVVQSMSFVTGNDFPARDPASWALYGTNDAIRSANHGTGAAENWSFIADGTVAMPDGRGEQSPVLSFSNSTPYTSYRLHFPTLKDTETANSMQIADINFFASSDGSGSSLLTPGDPVLAVQVTGGPQSESRTPGYPEVVRNAINNNAQTKYLNFGRMNSGFIVTPDAPSIVSSFQITTANDFPPRDPSSWILWGTNDPITSAMHSDGAEENWILIDQGQIDLPVDRFTAGPIVNVSNSTEYASYRMTFPTMRDPNVTDPANASDSIQFSEIQFFGQFVGVGIPGDHNGDGVVDARDYILWRKTGIGGEQGYTDWRMNFGVGSSGAGMSSAVPEPAAVVLLLFAVTAAVATRQPRARLV